jgi:hypothetical protein
LEPTCSSSDTVVWWIGCELIKFLPGGRLAHII